MLAAAGIVALEKMIDRLADDHANARRLAEGLADMPGFVVDLDRVQTNIMFFNLTLEVKVPNDVIVQRMLEHKVKILDRRAGAALPLCDACLGRSGGCRSDFAGVQSRAEVLKFTVDKRARLWYYLARARKRVGPVV